MKKLGVLLILMFVFAGAFVVAGGHNIGVDANGANDAKEVQGLIGNYSPLNKSGKVDYEKYKPFKTKADERIEKINLWLKNNASWLKAVFGIVPSVSWLFAINLWLWLFFFVLLALNADVTFGWLPFISKDKIDFSFFYTSWAQLFGLMVFIIILILKWIVNLANIIFGLFDIIWNYVLPMGFAFAIIAVILLGIGVLVSAPIALRIVGAIRQHIKNTKERKSAAEEAVNREALGKIVKGALED